MTEQQIHDLLKQAEVAKQNAYVPYSHFHVGACLVDDKGNRYLGCNVENASYGAAICAERTAVTKAVSMGAQKFQAIAITSDSDQPTYPCGICRQVLVEFAPDMTVICANAALDQYTVHKASELLPHYFGPDSMES